MLGQPMFLPTPLVVGVRVRGALPPAPPRPTWSSRSRRCSASTGWSAVRRVLRDGCSTLELADRATLSNMCPEYGATSAYWPVDDETLRYLELTGRGDRVDLVERYTNEQGLFRRDGDPEPEFTEILELDLAAIEPSVAGPKRPQNRVRSHACGVFVEAFRDRLEPDPDETDVGRLLEEGGKAEVAVDPDETVEPGTEARPAQPRRRPSRIRDRRDHELHEHVEPRGDARRRPAGEEGRRGGPGDQAVGQDLPRPGSRVVTEYLDAAGLTPYLDKLGSRSSVSGARRASGTRAAAGRGRGRRDRERPGRGRRPVGEPQLRGADPSARPSELPGIAAARGRLRPRRVAEVDLSSQPLGATAGTGPRCTCATCGRHPTRRAAIAASVSPEQFEREYGGSSTGTSVGAGCPRPRVPCTRGIRARPTCGSHRSSATLTRRPRSWSTSSAHAASSRWGLDHDRPHRRREPSRWVTGRSLPDRGAGSSNGTSTPTAPGAGTTR